MRSFGKLIGDLLVDTGIVVVLGILATRVAVLVHLDEPKDVSELLVSAAFLGAAALVVGHGRRRSAKLEAANPAEAGFQNVVVQMWAVFTYLFAALFMANIFKVSLESLLLADSNQNGTANLI